MGCCGEKRKEWSSKENSVLRPSSDKIADLQHIEKNKADKVFEYTGNKSLTINGTYSGKTYSFKTKGERLRVDYSDSFALMAERELRIVPQN